MQTGRPTLYTAEIGTAICERLAEGQSLRAICRDEAMPAESTVRGWVLDNREGFGARHSRARELQAHAMVDEIIEIADDGSNDTYQTPEGERTNLDHIQRARLRVDTRKWVASKVLPKIYGDRVTQEHAGTVAVQVETTIDRPPRETRE